MTRRERLELIVKGEITEELIEDCRIELEKLNEREAVRKSRPTENQLKNAEIEEKVVEVLAGSSEEEPVQIEELMERVGEDLTRQKLTSICTNLAKDGRIQKVQVKVKYKGKRMAYYV